MLPEFPEFKGIELEDRHEFSERLADCPARICELAFANLYIWQDFDRPKLTTVGDSLCVLAEPLSEPKFFLEPIGSGFGLETVELCIDHAGRISRATAGFVSSLPADRFVAEGLRNHYDYIYETRHLAELKGRRYDGKRNHIRAFAHRYPCYRYVELGKGCADEAFSIFDAWCRSKKQGGAAKRLPALAFECQRRALARAFEAYDELGIVGCGIEIEGSLAAFLLASPLCKDIVCVPLAYHIPGVQGLVQALLWEACRNAFARFKYVNLEQDLGLGGLRRHKESYYPSRMEEKFDVRMTMPPTETALNP